jgi:hypothetical protein
MPQDPHLYGRRPAKKQKRDQAAPTSLDFTAQMTALMAEDSSSAIRPRRPAPGGKRSTLFSGGKGIKVEGAEAKNRKMSAAPISLKEVQRTEEEARELDRSRRKMQEKARQYSAMKKGDCAPKDNELVDFDRKWAEGHRDNDEVDSSCSEPEHDDDEGKIKTAGADEMVEYVDEYGRTRKTTRAEKEKLDRRQRQGELGAEELERMAARPSTPQKVIYGDTIQTMAFNPDDPEKMESLARKRDRSVTPPPKARYDADSEFRDKGVGFYKFSKDEEQRSREMEQLQAKREETERHRKARDEAKEARRQQIEGRKRELNARRAKKMADSFLDNLATDLGQDTDTAAGT